MKRFNKISIVALISGMMLFPPLLISQETNLPKAKLPVLTTSAGQSADINTLNVIMNQAKVKYDYCDVPTVDMLQAGVGLGDRQSKQGFHVEIKTDLEKFKKGTPYKTIIFAIGASLKGMGASGLTVDSEVKRLKELIDYCKKNKIFIIAVHSGGESKRGAPGSDNEKMIDAVAPFADYLIVVKDSNKDGRFSKIAQEKGIPFTEVNYALNIVGVLKQVFAEDEK
ncbi:MAG: DUF6305 family protein [candidate division KSB1 bacterium]|nr:DUF6305 family protein [candidate division KSB1 bacterium]MDZ7336401.1 DUF6305 family protein [candidate division KSB1 bacterium]MDZ7358494.1 DUF6305 family protein [candidate division KSB1 bacterium]MDZ7401474.1 DUF6305 family protein [candidate division KSB1 bacterium]